jgi:hypothetical protein
MSFLMSRLLSPYMAPATHTGEDLSGDEAELAKLRGDALEDLEEQDEEEVEGAEEVKDEEEDEKDAKSKDEEADEGEEAESARKEKEEKDGKKTATIPKVRFDELRNKTKAQIEALTKQVEDLTKKATQETRVEDTKKTETAIGNLEKEIKGLMADGKTSEALDKMGELRILERALAVNAAKYESEQARAIAVEQVRMDLLIERLEQEYPEINPDADEYDEEKVAEIMELKEAFEAKGKSSSQALAKAVKYVFADSLARKDEAAKGKDKEKVEEKDEKEEKPKKADKTKEEDRKKEALKRNTKDAKKIPAKAADHGVDSDKKGGGITAKNVQDMTEEEFNALPESTKARLRGDTVDEED